MATEFKANVQEDYVGGWFIRLSDSLSGASEVCLNIDEFGAKLNEMSFSYGGEISVVWSKNSDVTDEHFYELHQQMAIAKQKLDEEL